MGKGVWGIDVGKSSVKAVRLEMRGGTPALTAVEVVPFPGAASGDTSNLDQQIVDALQELKGACRMGNEPVLISLPGHSTFNRLIKLPPVEDEKIPEIVQYEAQSQIPFNIDEVLWDYQVIQREYAPGEEKEVILFAIKRDIVEQFLANIAPAGLNVEVIQFAPVSLYNFLHYDQDLGGAAIALDMGGDNTDLVIIDGSKFWIRNLPITGNDITKALQKAFNVPFGDAEKLKLKAGQSQQAQKIFNAIQPVLRDLVGEIHRSIGYYKSISKTAKFDKIILLGNATKVLNFQKFVSQSLSTMGNLPAARLAKLGKIDAGGVDAGVLNRHLPTIGAALGLALQGFGLVENKVNLLPPAFVKKKEVKKKQPWIIGAVAGLYVLVLGAYFMMSSQVGALKEIYQSAQQAQGKWQDLTGRYEAAKNVGQIEADLKTLGSISPERNLALRLMNAVNSSTPNNGDPKKEDKDKLWIVDLRVSEESREPAKPADAQPGQQKNPLAVLRSLKIEIEVAIEKRAGTQEGATFIENTLLRPKVFPELGLEKWARGIRVPEGTDPAAPKFGWEIEFLKEASLPVPSGFKSEEEGPPKFGLYKVQIVIPMGAKDRATILTGPATAPK